MPPRHNLPLTPHRPGEQEPREQRLRGLVTSHTHSTMAGAAGHTGALGKKERVKILLLGDTGVGKSCFLSTFLMGESVAEPDAVVDPVCMPSGTHMVELYDSDSRTLTTPEAIVQLVETVNPHVVAMCLEPTDTAGIQRLQDFWLPALCLASPQPLISLLALKFDEGGSLSASDPDGQALAALNDISNPIQMAFPLVGISTYANALALPESVADAVQDMVTHAQYPSRPLCDEDEDLPTPAFKRALKRIFRSVNVRGFFLMGALERSRLQQYTLGLKPELAESALHIAAVQDRMPEGVQHLPLPVTGASVGADGRIVEVEVQGEGGAAQGPLALTFDGWSSTQLTNLRLSWAEIVWQMLQSMHCTFSRLPDIRPPASAVAAAVAAAAGPLSPPVASALHLLLMRRGARSGLALASPPSYGAWGVERGDQVVTLSKAGHTFLERLFQHYARAAVTPEGTLVGEEEAGPLDTAVLTPAHMDKVFATLHAPVDPSGAAAPAGAAAYYGASTAILSPCLDLGEAQCVSYAPPDPAHPPPPGQNAVFGYTRGRAVDDKVPCTPPTAAMGQTELLVGDAVEDPVLGAACGWWGHPFGPAFPWNLPHFALTASEAAEDVMGAIGVSQQYGTGFASRAGAAARLLAHVGICVAEALEAVRALAQHAALPLPAPGAPAADAAAVAGVKEVLGGGDAPALVAAVGTWDTWVAVHGAVATWAAAEAAAVPARRWALSLDQWMAAWHLLAATYPTYALRSLAALGFITHGSAVGGGGRESAAKEAVLAAAAGGDGWNTSTLANDEHGWRRHPDSLAAGGCASILPPLPALAPDAEAVGEGESLTGAGQDPHAALCTTPARKSGAYLPCPLRTVYVVGSPGVGKTALLQATMARKASSALPWAAARAAAGGSDPSTPLSSVDAASVRVVVEGGVPQPVIFPAPPVNMENERASSKQQGEDWTARREQLRGWPQHLLAVEWPAEQLGPALAKARCEADVVVVVVDPDSPQSVQFLQQALEGCPDDTPLVAVKAQRNAAGNAAARQASAQAVVDMCDAVEVDGDALFVEGATTARQLREQVWKLVADAACDCSSLNPATSQRTAKLAAAAWGAQLATAGKAAVVVGTLAAAGTAAYLYRKELAAAVRAVRKWALGSPGSDTTAQ